MISLKASLALAQPGIAREALGFSFQSFRQLLNAVPEFAER